jgi:hypothetical protein
MPPRRETGNRLKDERRSLAITAFAKYGIPET